LKSIDLAFKFRQAGEQDRERRSHYIEMMADDAELLAAVWTEVLVNLQKYPDYDGSTDVENSDVTAPDSSRYLASADPTEHSRLLASAMRHNYPPFSRLEAFRSRLHNVLDGNDKKFADLLVEKISELMHARNLTRETILKTFGEDHWSNDFAESLSRQMNRQAAELRALSEEFKAYRKS